VTLDDLRLGDVATFLAVQRVGSVTATARELEVTPSQVSKALARLEAQLGGVLLSRGARGVGLTALGKRLLPELERVAERVGRLRRPDAALEPRSEVTFAGASYLVSAMLPALAASQPGLRVRGLELPPALVRAYAAENVFDMALLGAARLPPSWSSAEIGVVRKSCFASPRLAGELGPDVKPERLRDVPFIVPIYVVGGRFSVADDDCPLPLAERRLGHETQTIAVALELAARTEQLVFGPVLAARRHLEAGALVEIRVRGWNVAEPLHLACNEDRVLARVRTAALPALRRVLADTACAP